MRVAGDHLHGAHIGTRDGVLVDGERVALGVLPHLPEPNARGAGDHQEPLPLAHVPVVALGDSGPGDVDGDLAALRRAQKLGERAAVVDIGPEVVGEAPRLVVGQERAPELLGEGALRKVGDGKRLAAVAEAVQQVDDLAQGLNVGPRDVAEINTVDALQPLVAAAVLPSQ